MKRALIKIIWLTLLKKNISQTEIYYNGLETLNEDRINKENVIIYLNIRSLNKNYAKL